MGEERIYVKMSYDKRLSYFPDGFAWMILLAVLTLFPSGFLLGVGPDSRCFTGCRYLPDGFARWILVRVLALRPSYTNVADRFLCGF